MSTGGPGPSRLAPEGQVPKLSTKHDGETAALVLRCQACRKKLYGNLALLDLMSNAMDAAVDATGIPHIAIPSCMHCGARLAVFPEEVCGISMELIDRLSDEAGAALVERKAREMGLRTRADDEETPPRRFTQD